MTRVHFTVRQSMDLWILLFFSAFVQLSSQSDLCVNQPCQNNGTCILVDSDGVWIGSSSSEAADYRCLCSNGWAGQNCTEDVDDCARNPCKNGGVCEDRSDMRYVCHCPPGFIGRTCEFVDPCTANPCENGARCQADILGRFTCHCLTWYHGLRCELERNPCYPENPCIGPGATCSIVRANQTTNHGPLVMDFNCTCGPGYTGRYCDTKVDLCAPNVCQNGAQCVDRGSDTLCICPVGYSGPYCEFKISAATNPQAQENNNLNEVRRTQSPANVTVQRMISGIECLNCPPEFAGDGICQVDCLLNGCAGPKELDDCQVWSACRPAGDTELQYPWKKCLERFHDGHCDEDCNNAACHFDGFDCAYSNPSCPNTTYCLENYADGVCHEACDTDPCGYDGGDCSPPQNNSLPLEAPPILLLVVMNTSMVTFAAHRQTVLFTMATVLHSVVRIWNDRQSGVEMLSELPNRGGVKMVLAIRTDPHYKSTNISSCADLDECSTNPIARLNDLELTRYIRAVMSAPEQHMPVALKQIVPITDETQLDFFKDFRRQTGLFKSGEVIGLYICLCILTAIVVLLVIFIVLQRDPWKKHTLKRVHTTGIWCPPGPFAFKDTQNSNSYTTQSNRPDKTFIKQQDQLLLPPDSLTTTEYAYQKNHHLLASFTDPLSETIEKPGLGSRNFSDVYGSDASMTQIHGKWCQDSGGRGGPSKRSSATSELNTPPTKQARLSERDATNHDQYLLDVNVADASAYQYSELSPLVPIQKALGCATQQNCSIKTDPGAGVIAVDHGVQRRKLQYRLHHVLQRQDGLHPLAPNSISLSDNVFENNMHSSIQNSHQIHSVRGTEFSAQIPQCVENFSSNHISDNHTVVDQGTGETLLHLAGRYNCGQDLVFSLPHLICNDDLGARCACVMWLDRHGRTALASAAAANALETTAALYQLEREAVSQNRTLLIGQSADQSHLSAKVRRRNRQAELRKSTPLIAAVQAGNEELVRHLVDEGYPIVGVDDFGRNVVHWASVTNAIDILQRLAQCKGFHRLVNARDDYDRTPLMLATREGCEQAVQFLLDHKANILTMDCTDSDALAIAKSKGFVDIEKLLLQRHAETNEDTLRITDSNKLTHSQVLDAPDLTEFSEMSDTHSSAEIGQQTPVATELPPGGMFLFDQYSHTPSDFNHCYEKRSPEDSNSPHLMKRVKYTSPTTTSELVLCRLPGPTVNKVSPK